MQKSRNFTTNTKFYFTSHSFRIVLQRIEVKEKELYLILNNAVHFGNVCDCLRFSCMHLFRALVTSSVHASLPAVPSTVEVFLFVK